MGQFLGGKNIGHCTFVKYFQTIIISLLNLLYFRHRAEMFLTSAML